VSPLARALLGKKVGDTVSAMKDWRIALAAAAGTAALIGTAQAITDTAFTY
jgi:hypothetical protein